MKKLVKFFGIIAFAAIIGFTFTACDTGGGGEGDDGGTHPRTLVVQGVTASQMLEADWGGFVGIFTVGTTVEQALEAFEVFWFTGAASARLISGGDLNDATISPTAPHTVTIPLYRGVNNFTARWTGSGNFTIFAVFDNGGPTLSGTPISNVFTVYTLPSVNFAGATTTVQMPQTPVAIPPTIVFP